MSKTFCHPLRFIYGSRFILRPARPKGGTEMAYQMTFRRYELKFMLTRAQKRALLQVMEPYMALDSFGRTTIQNLYYDTDSFRLVRRSMERPEYKEKLRVRSYGTANAGGAVFVELKKKYDGVVYKRRLSLPEDAAMGWLSGDDTRAPTGQIAREIDYFCDFYGDLKPQVFLSYEREAYFERSGGDFRVTFDDSILTRRSSLNLKTSAWGTPLLPPGMVLMELKTPGGIPLWMTRFLAEHQIYKTSFSKYGTAYQNVIFPQQEGVKKYA